MGRLIAETGNYAISVDREDSRLYVTLRGFWLDPFMTPDYVEDIRLATESLVSPFTSLVDVREMRTPGHLVRDLHIEAQKVTVAAGLTRSAEVFPKGISKELEFESYSVESKIVRRGFKSIEEAEKWLDQPDCSAPQSI
ncbi:MAG: hypothetical protein KAR40_10650 [Candidatus Sabulitectum sp.]|nr:hypothetical protein [Candidatus Sabulitectum sp.]